MQEKRYCKQERIISRTKTKENKTVNCTRSTHNDRNCNYRRKHRQIHQMVLGERRIKVRQTAEVTNMSIERVYHILNQHLGTRKLSERWVPRLLAVDQKRVRMNISYALLVQFRRNKSEFRRWLITVDETHYTPKTKIQSNQWTAKGDPASKKTKLFFRLGKWWRLFFRIVMDLF